MNADQIAASATEVQSIATAILDTVKVTDPGSSVPADQTEQVLALATRLLTVTLAAYSVAAGTPITAETVAALMPNQTPLTAPDA